MLVISRFAQLEFAEGDAEKGRNLFENLLVWLRRIEEEAWNVVQSIDAEDDDPPSSRRFVR